MDEVKVGAFRIQKIVFPTREDTLVFNSTIGLRFSIAHCFGFVWQGFLVVGKGAAQFLV